MSGRALLVDLHCHLDLFENPSVVIDRIRAERIFVLAVTTTPLACDVLRSLVGDSPTIRVAPGLHPALAAAREREVVAFAEQLRLGRYVGEIGLDGTPEHRSTKEAQRRVFSEILRHCAGAGGRAMTIHSRGAAREVLDALESQRDAGIPILHWFSGSAKDLARAVEMDCWFSVGPTMLRSVKGREIANMVPRHRLLTETDGPLAQDLGEALMPWDVARTHEQLSHVWEMPTTEVQLMLRKNFSSLVEAVNRFPADLT